MLIDFFQFLVAGLSQGAIYALVAIGFSVIYRATNIVNFAQGEFVMLGGLGTAGAIGMGVAPWAAALLALGIAVAAALLLDRLVIKLSLSAPVIFVIIVTIGASIGLRGAAQLLWGRDFYSIPTFVAGDPIRLGGVAILPQVLLILAVMLLLVLSLEIFFRRTRMGKAMLAAAVSPVAASLVGIELRHVFLITFAIAGMLGATAGLLITPISQIQFESGLAFGLKGFAAAILGGLGSVVGGVVGGFVLGLVEAFGAGYLSSAYKDAIAYILLVLMLLIKPDGLLGRSGAGRV